MKTVVFEKQKYGNEMFDTWKWLLKARSTDNTRPAINCIAVSGKRAIATDGYRMHIANVKDCGIESGVYKVVTSTAKKIVLQENQEGHLFPDWKAVLPRHMGKKIDLNWASSYRFKQWDTMSVKAARVIRALPNNFTISLSFLEDCISEGSWTMYPSKSGACPAYFKNCTRSAVIMPIRID